MKLFLPVAWLLLLANVVAAQPAISAESADDAKRRHERVAE